MIKKLVSHAIAVACAWIVLGCHNIGTSSPSDSTVNAVEQNQLTLVLSKSVKEWTVCDGVTDDSNGLAKAFAAAKNGAFTLDIDCPLYFHVGMDIARPIFIDNGTSVNFKGSGLIIVDNVLIPSFVIANSSNINLSNWKIQYDGGMSVDNETGGYYQDGVWVKYGGLTPPSHAFNNITLKNWLTINRNVRFGVNTSTLWTGPADAMAIFYLKGDTYNVNINNMNVFVSDTTSPNKFIPMVFSLNPGEVSNVSISQDSLISKPEYNVPHDVTFTNINLDGYYFGWHGSAQNMKIESVTANRYSDLQDSSGNNVGGIGKWFSPPHLFYFNYQPTWDKSLSNNNLSIYNVIDNGMRLGKPRDKEEDTIISGHIVSLKIQANNSIINNYISYRPDGLLDVLSSENLTIKNVTASYDSSFIYYKLPMVRFTQDYNKNVTLENFSLVDKAFITYVNPIQGSNGTNNTNIHLLNINIKMNNWGEPNPPMYSPTVKGTTPYFSGTGHSFEIKTTYNGMTPNRNINVLNPTEFDYGNNKLTDIKVGSFGLRSYIITNNTSETVYDLTFPPESQLPKNLIYDTFRTTCNLTNNGTLIPNQSCTLVLKYQPSEKVKRNYYLLKLEARDIEGIIIGSDNVYVPYSSILPTYDTKGRQL